MSLNPADFCYKNNFDINTDCTPYPMNTDCSTIGENAKKTCENCKNYTLANQYVNLNKGTSQNFLNLKEDYQNSWYQTGNLGVGILFLMVCIYYQK